VAHNELDDVIEQGTSSTSPSFHQSCQVWSTSIQKYSMHGVPNEESTISPKKSVVRSDHEEVIQ